jgi:hypothetical protein
MPRIATMVCVVAVVAAARGLDARRVLVTDLKVVVLPQ